MENWSTQVIITFVGGLIVLIVGAGYKSYKYKDLPNIKESGVTFFVGAVFSAIASLFGLLDNFVVDFESILGNESDVKKPHPETLTGSEFSGMVSKVTENMNSVSNWFKGSDEKKSEEILIGAIQF